MCETISNDTDSLKLKQVHIKKSYLIHRKEGDVIGLRDQGYPGFLTEKEYEIFTDFRNEVYRRDKDFRDTTFAFQSADEDEEYALCRWLRARKYNLDATIKMIEEATECRADVKRNNFYPSLDVALGVESSLYKKEYPQLYYGSSKDGYPLFISQPGRMNIDAIELLTTKSGLINYHWHDMMHQFGRKLKASKDKSNGKFVRYECVCILDLKELSAAKLGKRQMNIIKSMTFIDSLCFPETLNKMMIINAPAFFTMTWKIVRGWIDERTASKIEVIGTDPKRIFKKLSKIVDPSDLPADYGGSGIGIDEFFHSEMLREAEDLRGEGNPYRKIDEKSEVIHLRGHSTTTRQFTLDKNSAVKISILSKVKGDVFINVVNRSKGVVISEKLHHALDGDTDPDEFRSTRSDLNQANCHYIQGPGEFAVEFRPNKGKGNIMYILKEFAIEQPKVIERPKSQAESIIRSGQSLLVGDFELMNI
jgi:hypothetical protein